MTEEYITARAIWDPAWGHMDKVQVGSLQYL